jgi:hypothetical protein
VTHEDDMWHCLDKYAFTTRQRPFNGFRLALKSTLELRKSTPNLQQRFFFALRMRSTSLRPLKPASGIVNDRCFPAACCLIIRGYRPCLNKMLPEDATS